MARYPSSGVSYSFGPGGISPAVTYTPGGGPPSRTTLITKVDPAVPGFLKVVEAAHGSKAAEGIDISS